MRLLAALLLSAALAVPASAGEVDETQLLAVARAVNARYQVTLQSLIRNLQSPDPADRQLAVRTLGRLKDPRSVPHLVPWILHATRTPDELILGVTVLGRMGFETVVPQIRHLAAHEDAEVRKAAVSALHQIGAINAGDWMLRAKEEDNALRLDAVSGLGHAAHAEAAPMLIAGLSHPKALIRQTACIGLGRLGDQAHGEVLKIALTDSDPMVRRYAAEALAKLDYKAAIPDLLMALEANVAAPYILRSVRQLTGEDFGYDPHAPLLHRQLAIERAFAWLTANPAR